jgi:hypothetical protein
VIVLLGIAEAQVLAVGCLPMAFLSMWCRTMAEAGCRFHRLVAECAGVAECAFAVEVEVVAGGS